MRRPVPFLLSIGLSFLPVLQPSAAAASDKSLAYLTGYGAKAAPVVPLTWGVLGISCGVILIIGLLLLGAVWRGPSGYTAPAEPGERLPVTHPPHGIEWIWIGVGISTVVLLGALVWTMVVVAHVEAAPRTPAFKIEITGHQWWWEVRYLGKQTSRTFTTANEIHIPTGVPIGFELRSADVIHSFWIPELSGKTDTVPGQVNELWLEADKPGHYYGQCTEYCGVQHAHMRMVLVAQRPKDFALWWKHQLEPAPKPKTAQERDGLALFTVRCGSCHTVRGTDANGVLGPDLSHLMARNMIAAGSLPNNVAYLSGWIADPQEKKPGALMPKLELTGPELADIRSYVETLK